VTCGDATDKGLETHSIVGCNMSMGCDMSKIWSVFTEYHCDRGATLDEVGNDHFVDSVISPMYFARKQ
jgi:hypothetical protein